MNEEVRDFCCFIDSMEICLLMVLWEVKRFFFFARESGLASDIFLDLVTEAESFSLSCKIVFNRRTDLLSITSH